MDIISHFCSGICVGSLLSIAYYRDNLKKPMVIPLIVGFGTLVPDWDGITLFFSHKIYYGSLPYSHHGILHTPIGSLLMITCLFLVVSVIGICLKKDDAAGPVTAYILLYFGCLLHIAEDIPCPPGPWQGFMLLWPISDQRFSSWAHIGWTNEFLVVIFSCGALLTWILSSIINKLKYAQIIHSKVIICEINLGVTLLALLYVFISRYQNPLQWENYQSNILGESLYSCVKWLNTIIEPLWSHEIF